MTESNPKPGQLPPPQGPISQQRSANSYLEDKKIPQIFESLLAGLMLECPDDHMTYLNMKLDLIKEIGTENIAWDSFIVHLHPDSTKVQQQNLQKSDLPHTQPDNESSGRSESFQQPGSSQLFELTDPTLADSTTNETNYSSEAAPVFYHV